MKPHSLIGVFCLLVFYLLIQPIIFIGKQLWDQNYIINEYKKGKSSLIISKYLGISKPIILNILNKHNVVRKRDRCSSLNINKTNDKHIAIRICPKCKDKVKVSSNNSSTTCRNYYKIVEKGSLCRKCSLELQKGISNQIISFLAGNDVSLSTLKKIDEYVNK